MAGKSTIGANRHGAASLMMGCLIKGPFMQLRQLALLIGLCAAPALADENLRCGNLLVAIGDSTGRVLERCGTPQARSTSIEPVFATNRRGKTEQVGSVEVQRWRYDRGSNQFTAQLRFEDGELKRIDYDY